MVSLTKKKSFVAVGRHQHVVAAHFQGHGRDTAHLVVVFDEQHRFLAREQGTEHRTRFYFTDFLGNLRQVDFKGSATSYFTIDGNITTALLNNTVNGREA